MCIFKILKTDAWKNRLVFYNKNWLILCNHYFAIGLFAFSKGLRILGTYLSQIGYSGAWISDFLIASPVL